MSKRMKIKNTVARTGRMMTMGMDTVIKMVKVMINKKRITTNKIRKTTKSNKTRMNFSDKQMLPSKSNVRRTREFNNYNKTNSIKRKQERMLLRDKKRTENKSRICEINKKKKRWRGKQETNQQKTRDKRKQLKRNKLRMKIERLKHLRLKIRKMKKSP
jgi:hypothetical protein